jgi:hypothetical protein
MEEDEVREENGAPEGISIDLISTERLEELGVKKIRFIVDQVKNGKVLVLEKGLTPAEELDLIKVTMTEIDHDSFIGVETPGFTGNIVKRSFLQKLLGRSPPPRMMVVGPAHLLKTIKKDGRTIQAVIVTREEFPHEERPQEEEESPDETGEKKDEE